MSRLKPVSDKRRKSRPARHAAVREALERDGHRCQAQYVWPHECFGDPAPHEPHKKSAGGDEFDSDQILTVCQMVNSRIEDEPEWARSLGLSVHSWETWSYERDWGSF